MRTKNYKQGFCYLAEKPKAEWFSPTLLDLSTSKTFGGKQPNTNEETNVCCGPGGLFDKIDIGPS